MTGKLTLEVAVPERLLVEEEVDEVQIPAADGTTVFRGPSGMRPPWRSRKYSHVAAFGQVPTPPRVTISPRSAM